MGGRKQERNGRHKEANLRMVLSSGEKEEGIQGLKGLMLNILPLVRP